MFKRTLSLGLSLVTALSLSVPALAAETTAELTQEQVVAEAQLDMAEPSAAPTHEDTPDLTQAETSTTVETEDEPTQAAEAPASQTPVFYVNGQSVQDAAMTAINGEVYLSVRAFFTAALAQCQVEWMGGSAVITGVTAGGESLTVTARPGENYLVANERYLYVPQQVQNLSGNTLAPAWVLADIFNGYAHFDANGVCSISLGTQLLTHGSAYYDQEQVDLLSRLIFAEAGNQPLKGKLAVGNVILNRVADPRFPNTIYGVIYEKNQFSVVRNGAINKTPSASAIIAAKLALDGAEALDGVLFFNRSGLNCWAARNRTYVTTIGGHDFYV